MYIQDGRASSYLCGERENISFKGEQREITEKGISLHTCKMSIKMCKYIHIYLFITNLYNFTMIKEYLSIYKTKQIIENICNYIILLHKNENRK